jgi:outer membrane protein, heavy metal efflux system
VALALGGLLGAAQASAATPGSAAEPASARSATAGSTPVKPTTARPRSETVSGDARLTGPLDRQVVMSEVVARSPGLRAARRRADAMLLAAEAEDTLPPPMLEFQITQVPMDRPWDIPNAQMIMLGVKQDFPAPGSLSARSEAMADQAGVERAMTRERLRELETQAEQALADYAEATRKLGTHLAHRTTAERILTAARARYSAGGMLTDVAQADVELAQIEADVAGEQANVLAAKAKLNGLLLRSPSAPLGEPVLGGAETLGEPVEAVIARARRQRPEVGTAEAKHTAGLASVRAAESEAAWPMFSVGLAYYAPTMAMPMLTAGSYGVSFSSTLPWAWGRGAALVRAERAKAAAVGDELADVDARVAADVATAAAAVQAETRRYQALQDRSLPASRRAVEASAAGYESGGTSILALLTANRSVVEIELMLVETRAALDHALAQLDWAAGASVARVPIVSPADAVQP